MNRGRSTSVVIGVLFCALLLSACGGSSTKTTASGATGTTPATGASGSTKTKGKSTKSAGSKSSGGKSKSSAPTGPYTAAEPIKGSKKQITAIVSDMVLAIHAQDANHLCSSIYSLEYVKILGKQGGCAYVVKQRIVGIKDFSMKVVSIKFSSPSDARVVCLVKINGAKGARTTKPTLSFKRELGSWRYNVQAG